MGRKHHGKRPAGKFREKQDNIKLFLKEMGHADFNGPEQGLTAGSRDDGVDDNDCIKFKII